MVAWAIGFFGYKTSGLIHVLLVMAVVAVILSFIKNEG